MRKLLSKLSSTLQGGVRGGLLLLLLVASVSAIYASDTQVDGIWYDFNNSTMTASVTYQGNSYYYNEYSGIVIIPETVTYNSTTYSVTSIGNYAFSYCDSLTSITIPNSVTSIGDRAFYGCYYLTSVTIPNSVTSIGDDAFSGCSSLISITIPESVTSIGDRAFQYCSSLPVEDNLRYADTYLVVAVDKKSSTYSIKEGTKWIGSDAFSGCSSLTSVTIPNSVTSIGYDAFYGCSSLTSMTIPNSVTSIGDRAFMGCNSISSIVVNEDNTIYDSRENCNAIIETATNTLIQGCQNTSIPNSVTSIGDYAFYNCSSLTSITIPNSVTSIGNYAFYSCSSLTSITIPNSVTSIGNRAFSGCSALTSPIYNANCFAYMPTSYMGFYEIPEGIRQIAGGAFDGCSSLTSVTIPESMTSIGEGAFSNCSSLTSMTIPNCVTSIGNSAFSGCSSLTSITIPESVTSIGNSAFCGCSSLTSITIPNSVTSIGNYAFSSCSSLTSITIPESVTSIGESAFYWCSALTSIIIPNSVTSIEHRAFYWCSALTSIIIPNSVTSIGGEAFYGCSSLTSITCEATTPPTLRYGGVFYKVSTKIPVYVPCGCVEAYKAASGWENFTNIQEPLAEYSIEVNVNDTIMGSAKVDYNTFCEGAQISTIPNIGYHFVQWNDGNTENPRTLELTQDTILTAEFAQSFSGQCGDDLYWNYDETAKTISITGSGNMYDYTADTQPWLLFKEQITEVTTSNTVTSIGTSAFEGCVRLGKVTFGSSAETIAANAFAGCTRLYDIYVYATYPPFAEESSFANYNVYLYVPCESQRDYILDIVWGKFKFIECIDSEDVTTDGVVITPSTNDVTIIWPTETEADTYTIVIKKGNEVFCTLTFNADGQLLNIAFAPGRDGNHPVQYAEQAVNGYRFTVTGLEEATHYAYNIDVKDAADKTIKSYTGEFTTHNATSVENTHSQSPMTTVHKLLRDGQLYIYHNGSAYTIMGQKVSENF